MITLSGQPPGRRSLMVSAVSLGRSSKAIRSDSLSPASSAVAGVLWAAIGALASSELASATVATVAKIRSRQAIPRRARPEGLPVMA